MTATNTAELETLRAALDSTRAHILAAVDALDDGQLSTATVTPNEVIAGYRRQIDASNAVLDTVEPDDPPRRRDPLWGEWGVDFPTVRAILLHMIVETATHAGHLDAAAELVDGRQHLVID